MVTKKTHLYSETLLLKSTLATCSTAYEADRFHGNPDDAAFYAGVKGREQIASKSVEFAEYFRWLRATGTAEQLQQTYSRPADTSDYKLSSHGRLKTPVRF